MRRKIKKRFWGWIGKPLVVLLAIFSILAASFYYLRPQVSHCFLIDSHEDFVHDGNLHMSSGAPVWIQDSLKVFIQMAKSRNVDFWGELKSEPVIIFCHDPEEYATYGVAGKPAAAWLSAAGAYITLSQKGFNLDIIAHEMAHAELLERVGWFKRDWEIPTWFDEGLAMQVDFRPRYGSYYFKYYTNLGLIPQIKHLKNPELFWTGDKKKTRLKYIAARQEVKDWLGSQPKLRLLSFLKRVREGEDFETAYEAPESDASINHMN